MSFSKNKNTQELEEIELGAQTKNFKKWGFQETCFRLRLRSKILTFDCEGPEKPSLLLQNGLLSNKAPPFLNIFELLKIDIC